MHPSAAKVFNWKRWSECWKWWWSLCAWKGEGNLMKWRTESRKISCFFLGTRAILTMGEMRANLCPFNFFGSLSPWAQKALWEEMKISTRGAAVRIVRTKETHFYGQNPGREGNQIEFSPATLSIPKAIFMHYCSHPNALFRSPEKSITLGIGLIWSIRDTREFPGFVILILAIDLSKRKNFTKPPRTVWYSHQSISIHCVFFF